MHYYVTMWQWHSLHYLLFTIARHTPLEQSFEFEIFKRRPHVAASLDQRLRYVAHITALIELEERRTEGPSTVEMPIYFWSLLGIMLQSAWMYSRSMGADMSEEISSSERAQKPSSSAHSESLLVLLAHKDNSAAPTRTKDDPTTVRAHAGRSPQQCWGNNNQLLHSARVNLDLVSRCWARLRTTHNAIFDKEFERLSPQWQLDECAWLQQALGDMTFVLVWLSVLLRRFLS